jgi:hypothetical protein
MTHEAVTQAREVFERVRWKHSTQPPELVGAMRQLLEAYDRLEARVKELEASMVGHFQREHLEGDGPEIDRWKCKVDQLRRDLQAAQAALKEASLVARSGGTATIEQAARWAEIVGDKPHETVIKHPAKPC